MGFLKKLNALADAKVIDFPSKPSSSKSPLLEKVLEKLKKSGGQKSNHVENMRQAAKVLKIPYQVTSIFKMLDAIDAYLAKKASQDQEISRILFDIKSLKAEQRRDLSDDKPAKKIETLREKAITKILEGY